MQMVSLTPEVIIAGGAAPTRALQQATHTIPIIITQGGDVAANGLVKDIAHPEGNITGFTQFRADDRRKVAGTAQSGRAERRQSRDRRHNRRRKRKPRRRRRAIRSTCKDSRNSARAAPRRARARPGYAEPGMPGRRADGPARVFIARFFLDDPVIVLDHPDIAGFVLVDDEFVDLSHPGTDLHHIFGVDDA